MQDRLELERLAEQQAALRRVATLVARGASSTEVFDAVAQEVAQVLRLANAAVCRYDEGGTVMTVLAVFGERPESFAQGSHWQLEGQSMSAEVLRTGRPVRFDDYTHLRGPLAAAAREHGFDRVAGAPIIVDGRVWGVISTSSPDAPLPEDLEDRLAEFTELVATAIANTQAHEETARLAEEQAALRHVATLVAEGAAPAKVFEAVTIEVAQLVGADGSALTRYETDGTVTVLAGWTNEGSYLYIGRRFTLEGTVSGVILETGRPGRIDNYMDAPGSAPDAAREMGWRSSVGAPITVGGSLWGALAVISRGETPLPVDTERRLAQFTDLVSTALANAESGEELAKLAGEQAALRRVATLVAEGALPVQVFAAVRDEVAQVIGVPVGVMLRYDADGMATVVATSGEELGPVGQRWKVEDARIAATVLATGRTARIDDVERGSGPMADRARKVGVRSAVGVPIVVEGVLWGVMSAGSPEPLPQETGARLAKFTELLAIAIANAGAREALHARGEEQSALRRLATLVARGVPPAEILDAVAAEVVRLLGCDWAGVNRFEPDAATMVLSSYGALAGDIPVGLRATLDEGSLVASVMQTGRSARVEAYDHVPGPWAAQARELGIRSAVGAPITVDRRVWGVMVAVWTREGSAPVADAEARITDFTELVGTAIANAEGRAELAASRARIVATADATRRRIERDLHDGAQQQLVSLALLVRAAQAAPAPERGEHRTDLSHIAERLTHVLDGLREIALGLHPAILAEGGLAAALNTLAHRSPIPVELDMRIEGRLPEAVEVAAYYVVSEALTNAAKHSHASVARVAVEKEDGMLLVAVRDDGDGGADTARGSGLLGLKDRAEAIGGSIEIDSRRGSGTALRVELPLYQEKEPLDQLEHRA